MAFIRVPFPPGNYLYWKVSGEGTCFYPALALSSTIWAGRGPKPPVQESLTRVAASQSCRLRAVLAAVLLGRRWRGGLLALMFLHGLLSKTHILQPFPPCIVDLFCVTSLILRCSNKQLYQSHLDTEPNPNPPRGYSHVVVLHCGRTT